MKKEPIGINIRIYKKVHLTTRRIQTTIKGVLLVKYFAICFIAGVFLFIYIVFPIMDALEVPGLVELLGMLVAYNSLLFVLLGTLSIFIILFFVYKSVKKSRYV